MIVVLPPSLDKDLRIIESIKVLPIKQFVSEFPVEGLDITVSTVLSSQIDYSARNH